MAWVVKAMNLEVKTALTRHCSENQQNIHDPLQTENNYFVNSLQGDEV
jgi:hypothetical protein